MRRRVGRAAVVITATGHNRQGRAVCSPPSIDNRSIIEPPKKKTAAGAGTLTAVRRGGETPQKNWTQGYHEPITASNPFPTLVRPIRGTSGGV